MTHTEPSLPETITAQGVTAEAVRIPLGSKLIGYRLERSGEVIGFVTQEWDGSFEGVLTDHMPRYSGSNILEVAEKVVAHGNA